MTRKEILVKLKSLGNKKMFAQNIKNGTSDNQYGVRLGDLRKVAEEIKTDHELALEPWKIKYIDTQLLFILIIKPKLLSSGELDEMVKSIEFVQVAALVQC